MLIPNRFVIIKQNFKIHQFTVVVNSKQSTIRKNHSIIRGYKGSFIYFLLRNKRKTVLIIIAFSDCRKMHSLSLRKKTHNKKEILMQFNVRFKVAVEIISI